MGITDELRMILQSSIPSTSGSIISSKIRSGLKESKQAIAFLPLSHSLIENSSFAGFKNTEPM